MEKTEEISKCEICMTNNVAHEGATLCDRCWELKTRIEDNVPLATRIILNYVHKNNE